jgi:hypothetical protein
MHLQYLYRWHSQQSDGYNLDKVWFLSEAEIFLFTNMSEWLCGPPSLLSNVYWVLFPQ